MYRSLGLLSLSAALSMLAITATPAPSSAQGSSAVACAGATTTTTSEEHGATTSSTTTLKSGSSPAPGGSCWEEVQPYPFGSEGGPVDTANAQCSPNGPEGLGCYLTVTSMAFRAWNRGLAVTTNTPPAKSESTSLGVWIFNGTSWYPDPTFLGSKTCPGHTIVWAGKLDYWLVGDPSSSAGATKWANICRFDGATHEWEPLEIPTATKEHVTEKVEFVNGQEVRTLKPGSITSAACFAWNNCWFFGTYGTVLHWSGGETSGQPPLVDASPEPSQSLLQGEYTAAVARQGPAGEPFGVAVAATSEDSAGLGPLSSETDDPPTQMYGSSGEAFSPLAFTPFTIPETLESTPPTPDPYRTDLIAVDYDSEGQGWVAGNPAGLRLTEREGQEPRGEDEQPQQPPSRRLPSAAQHLEQPSPLEPVPTSGAATACADPPSPTRFTYTPFTEPPEQPGTVPGAFLWSSIGVLPGADEALAGGQMRSAKAGSGPNEDVAVGEPVIAQAGCNGTTTLTRFRIADPTDEASQAPGDREGGVTAIAANAINDAWAATSKGVLKSGFEQPPRLYRLTNGEPPQAPEGNDSEERPPNLKIDVPITVIEPPQPEPPPEEPPEVVENHKVTLPPAIYDVKAKLHTIKRHGKLYLDLYITFKLRRAVTVGAHALEHGHVVSVAKPKHFAGHTGLLILSLNRKHWPTKVNFVS
jgi:hypothetical protein